MTPDVVYVYKRNRSDELRYSLRSLANVPHRFVWFVGDPPNFPHTDRVRVVSSSHAAPTPQDVTRNHLIRFIAAAGPDVTPVFYLFNDDFYVLDPVDEIPLYHRGPVDELDRYADRTGMPVATDFIATEYATAWHLADKYHVARADSYSLHIPMPVHVGGARRLLPDLPNGLRFRTFYGNLDVGAHTPGGYHPDVKVRRTDEHPNGLTPYTSTYEKSFLYGVVGDHIRSRFPDPSPYERTDQ